MWSNIKTLMPKTIFSKKEIFVQILYLATALGRFNQCFFFVVGQPWWLTSLLSHPRPFTIEKFPTALIEKRILMMHALRRFDTY